MPSGEIRPKPVIYRSGIIIRIVILIGLSDCIWPADVILAVIPDGYTRQTCLATLAVIIILTMLTIGLAGLVHHKITYTTYGIDVKRIFC